MARHMAIAGRWLAWMGLTLVVGALSSGTVFAQGLSGSTASDLVHVAVHVDTAFCASGGVQCTSTGHTAEPAAAGNHNPVRIVIQISATAGNGLLTGVDGLPSSVFQASSEFVPGGGVVVERLSCAVCFQSMTGGTYALYVHPRISNPPGPNVWRSGSYFVQISFLNGGVTVFPTIARIDIP